MEIHVSVSLVLWLTLEKQWDLLWSSHHKGLISRSGSLRTLSGKVPESLLLLSGEFIRVNLSLASFLKSKTKHAGHFYLTVKKQNKNKVRQSCQCHVWFDQRVVLAANKTADFIPAQLYGTNSVCAPVCAEAAFFLEACQSWWKTTAELIYFHGRPNPATQRWHHLITKSPSPLSPLPSSSPVLSSPLVPSPPQH